MESVELVELYCNICYSFTLYGYNNTCLTALNCGLSLEKEKDKKIAVLYHE